MIQTKFSCTSIQNYWFIFKCQKSVGKTGRNPYRVHIFRR